MTCHSRLQTRLGLSIQNPGLQMTFWVCGAIRSFPSSLCLFSYLALVSGESCNISHFCLGSRWQRDLEKKRSWGLYEYLTVMHFLCKCQQLSDCSAPTSSSVDASQAIYHYFWSFIQISVSLAKDEPDTNLVALMKEEGVKLLREAMGIYISTLKTGILLSGYECLEKIVFRLSDAN